MRLNPAQLAVEMIELVMDGRGNDNLSLAADGAVVAWLDQMPDFFRINMVIVDIDPHSDADAFTLLRFDDARVRDWDRAPRRMVPNVPAGRVVSWLSGVLLSFALWLLCRSVNRQHAKRPRAPVPDPAPGPRAEAAE